MWKPSRPVPTEHKWGFGGVYTPKKHGRTRLKKEAVDAAGQGGEEKLDTVMDDKLIPQEKGGELVKASSCPYCRKDCTELLWSDGRHQGWLCLPCHGLFDPDVDYLDPGAFHIRSLPG
eukprot:g70818.t1